MSTGFSAYPGEEEVLLNDGLQYRVINKELRRTEKAKSKNRIELGTGPAKQQGLVRVGSEMTFPCPTSTLRS